jgi:fatty acid synthase subunit alpha, fungi type/fatty acid synthase subunit beta, fungi type
MSVTNALAEHVEAHGTRTFSAKEMAVNILGLMHPLLFSITQVEPIWADLSSGMDCIPDLADVMTTVRPEMNAESTLRRSITRDNAADFQVINSSKTESAMRSAPVTPRANLKFDFPKLESPESLADLACLQGLFDLDKVLVITRFAEVRP